MALGARAPGGAFSHRSCDQRDGCGMLKSLKFLRLALLAAGLTCGSAVAETINWNGYSLTVPAGWQVSANQPGALGLTLKSDRQTVGAIIFSQGPASGSLSAPLAALTQSAVGPGAFDPSTVRDAVTQQGWPVAYAYASAYQDDIRLFAMPAAINAGANRINALMIDFDDACGDRCQIDFGAAIASLSRAGALAAPVSGSGGLNGFYVFMAPGAVVNPVGGVRVETGVQEIQFLPGGRFVLANPHDAPNADAYCAKRPTNCGVYSATGNQFTRYRPRTAFEERLGFVGKDAAEPMKRDAGGGLEIGGVAYTPISASRGTPLDGDFVSTTGGSATDATGATRSLYAETVYRFRKDGRMWTGGYAAFTSDTGEALPDGRVATTMGGNRAARAGTYVINGFTITLAYADGAREQNAFYLFQGSPVIDGDFYARR